jgi:hypothetical protein
MMPTFRRFLAPILFSLAVAFAGSCGKDSPTTPSANPTPAPSATPAPPAVTQVFEGTVGLDGSAFYSFTVTQYGTVNVTLTSVSGAFVRGTVTMGLGLGQPSGEDCAVTNTLDVKAGSTPQITGSYQPAVYCVKISDRGNLFAPAKFSITIEYP